jgi:hypothetical protein
MAPAAAAATLAMTYRYCYCYCQLFFLILHDRCHFPSPAGSSMSVLAKHMLAKRGTGTVTGVDKYVARRT